MDSWKAALFIAAVLTIGAIVRLLALGVHRQLSWLVVFLSFSAFQLIVPGLTFPVTSRLYRDIYFFSEPITWMLAVLMIQEMYHHVFLRYPAISGLGKWSTYAAAISAVAVCAVMISVTPAHQITSSVLQTYTIFWEDVYFFYFRYFHLVHDPRNRALSVKTRSEFREKHCDFFRLFFRNNRNFESLSRGSR